MIADRFRKIQVSLPQTFGGYKSRLHPTDAILACGSYDGQVTIFKAANGSVPFSEWRIEREFKCQNLKHITNIEWNVSYSISSPFYSIIWSYYKWRCIILITISTESLQYEGDAFSCCLYNSICRCTGPN